MRIYYSSHNIIIFSQNIFNLQKKKIYFLLVSHHNQPMFTFIPTHKKKYLQNKTLKEIKKKITDTIIFGFFV